VPGRIAALRHHGYGGGVIAPHRALATLRVTPADLAGALVLALALTLGWFVAAEQVCGVWTQLFQYGCHALAIPGPVVVAPLRVGPWLQWWIPSLAITAGPPGPATYWVTAAASVVTLIASVRLSDRHISLKYFLRIIVGIQASTLISFAFPRVAGHANLADEIADLLTASLVLMAGVPLLLGLTYYIFDFTLVQKLGLTALILLHLSLFVPLQCLLLAYSMHRYSLLFRPMLHLLLGFPLDIMTVIAFYGWGMSWKERAK
jgi:hypothetical protein